MKRFLMGIALIGFGSLLQACTDTSDQNVRLLESMGMSQVKLGGYGWFACSQDDTYSTKFEAVGANGQPVSGTLCGGFLKGTTVRFD